MRRCRTFVVFFRTHARCQAANRQPCAPCIERTAINGQPVGQDEGEASPEDQAAAADQAEGAGLRGEAEQMSGMGGQ